MVGGTDGLSSTEALFTIAPSFFNAFFAAIAIVLHHGNQASPSRFLLMCSLFLLSWVVQFRYWTSCNISAEAAATTSLTQLRFCVIWRPLAEFGNVEGGVLTTRFILGALCMSWWAVLVSCSGAAMFCERLRRDFERWTDEEEGARKEVGEDEEIDRGVRESFEELVRFIDGIYEAGLVGEGAGSSEEESSNP